MIFGALIATVTLMGLLLIAAGLRRLWRRRPLSGGLQGLLGAALLAAGALSGGLAANLYTYHRLTQEMPVAKLSFVAMGPQHYEVWLRKPDGEASRFELRGDEWQLDARILKWHGTATLLGLDTVYRLERISGRYRALEDERSGPRTVQPLCELQGLDLWRLARRHERWLPWVDTVYGSAAYMPMADGAQFEVTVSPTGLVARPLNAAARSGWAAPG